MPTRAASPLRGFLKRHLTTELVIDASTLKVLKVLWVWYTAHYPGGGFCASGAVCCSLLHVRSHHNTEESEPSTRRDSQSLANKGKAKGRAKGG
jgi:hypothetical protein